MGGTKRDSKGGRYHIVDAAPDPSLDGTELSLTTMRTKVNPREEWAQVFHESWRILIGTRTWGGVVGLHRYPPLIDGGGVTAPSSAFYEIDGTWGIEGHGVEPDVEVIDDPAKMVDGGAPQLDEAITLMLAEIQRRSFTPAQRPAYPDRRGMGIPESDW